MLNKESAVPVQLLRLVFELTVLDIPNEMMFPREFLDVVDSTELTAVFLFLTFITFCSERGVQLERHLIFEEKSSKI